MSTSKLPRDAEATRDFNDHGSQFFICATDQSGLDRRYTVFGQVIQGLDIIDKIIAVPRDDRDNPLEPIVIKVTITE